jgi:hypothetical protein
MTSVINMLEFKALHIIIHQACEAHIAAKLHNKYCRNQVSRMATYFLESSKNCRSQICIALHIVYLSSIQANECMEVFKHAGTAHNANVMLACYNTYRLTNVLYCTLVKRASV